MNNATVLFEFCTFLTFLTPERKAEVMADDTALYNLVERFRVENELDEPEHADGYGANEQAPNHD